MLSSESNSHFLAHWSKVAINYIKVLISHTCNSRSWSQLWNQSKNGPSMEMAMEMQANAKVSWWSRVARVCNCNRLLPSQAGSQAHHSHNPLSRPCNQPRKTTKVLKYFDPPGNLSLHHISITGISNLPLQVTGDKDRAVSRLVVDFPTCASCLVHGA